MNKINVVHAFSGVDSQLMAEKRVWGDRVNLLATMEVDVDAIISCAAIHENEKFVKFLERAFTSEQYEQAKVYLKDRNIGFDFEKGKSKIDRMKKEKLRQLFIASKLTKNLGDISLANKVKMSEEVDIFTYSSPCFLKGTLVSTDKGLVCIEDIKKGDMVLTHNNVYKRVVTPMLNHADHIYKFKCMASEDLYVTGEHPFYVRERYWGTNGDRYAKIPRDMKQGKLKMVRMFKDPEFKKVSELDNNYYVGTPINNLEIPYKWDGCLIKSQWGHGSIVKNEISNMLDKEDFWWIVGRFIGDGWVDRWDIETGGIKICSANTNTKNVSDVEVVLDRLGINYNKTEQRTGTKFVISKQEYKQFFRQFGRGAENKVIPQDVLNIPKHLLKSLLEGYWSADGCFENDLYKATSVSKKLVISLAQAVHKVYKKGTSVYKTKRKPTCVIEGRIVNQKDTYSITFRMNNHKSSQCFEDNGYIWSPIKSIEKQEYSGDVYNFEVEDDNSYVVHNVIVHNCQSFSLAGKLEGIKGTSGLLLECEKFIEINKPKVLLLENVKNLVGKQFKPDFDNWCDILDKLGYNTYWEVLNAKQFGVAQNRQRVFALSIRKDVDCGYEFPEGFPLQTRLKDVLEEDIDPKYYLSDEIVARFKAKMPSINSDIKIVESTAPESKRIGGIFDDEKGKHQAGSIWDKEYLAPTIDTCQGGYRMPCIVDDIETKWKEFGNTGYMVSSEGVIKNKDGSIKSQRADKDGYLRANLMVDGTGKTIRSHRLVATVFIENPKNLETVNHKDGNILNNSVSNLEWCSIEDNLKHRAEVLRTGGMKPNQPKGVHFNKDRNLWEVSMKIENKTTYLGRFKTKEDGYECYYYKFIEIKGYEPWNEEEYKAFTYRQSCIIADGEATTNRQPLVLEEPTVCEQRSDEGLRYFKDNICGAIRANKECGGDKRIIEPIIVASRGRYNEEGVVEQNLEFNSEGISNTLTTVQKDNYVAEPLLIKEATKKGYAEAYDGDSVNLEQPNSQTRRGRVGTQIANTLMTSCAQGVVEGYRIRKLTPKECWNLMDFDADAFGKASPYISDSALYKQAGNSIVVACMEHIFNNLDIDKIKGGLDER